MILLAAAIQGCTLYALHMAVKLEIWPATQPALLFGLYAVAVFLPLTLQLLVDHARHRSTWLLASAVAVVFFYFGWHHGGVAVSAAVPNSRYFEHAVPWLFVLGVVWLLLPFL